MRKQKILFFLLISLLTFLVAGCASFSTGNIQGSASLSSSNFVYIENGAKGESSDVTVLGIGGGLFKKESLAMSAKNDLLNQHPLRKNQAYANMSVSYRNSFFLGLVTLRSCYVTADVVEFIPETGDHQLEYKDDSDPIFFNNELDEDDVYRQYQYDDVEFEMVKVGGIFWGRTEVTQELWLAVMGSNPSYFSGTNGYVEDLRRPVESITKKEISEFIKKLSDSLNISFRLPTVREMKKVMETENLKDADDYAWCKENSYQQTHPVAQKQANELYDLFGNVAEICTLTKKVFGGTYMTDSEYLDKEVILVANARKYVGFRLVVDK